MSQAQPVRYLDAYIRVSRVGKRRGPSFISPLVQREAIEAWARHQRVELLEVFEEFDESGARRDRPLLQRALERVEHHVSTGIVVWRVDRFGRSLADGVRNIERIRAAGGAFYSVGDGLDINSPAGRLVLGILLSVAEYQLDGIRDSWDAAAERAIRRGIHVEPLVPVGYRKTRTGRLKPHAVNGPILTELYELRASGGSQRSCAGFLEQHGVLTGKGN